MVTEAGAKAKHAGRMAMSLAVAGLVALGGIKLAAAPERPLVSLEALRQHATPRERVAARLVAQAPGEPREALAPRPGRLVIPLEGVKATDLKELSRELAEGLTLAEQGRVDLEFCPMYLPEDFPEQTTAEQCRDSLLWYSTLFQEGKHNPYVIADKELEHLNSGNRLASRLSLATAYLALGRARVPERLPEALWLLIKPQTVGERDVVFGRALGELMDRLPRRLAKANLGEGEIGLEVVATTATSHDSVASVPELLLAVHARGLQVVAIADRDRIDGAREAQRTAEKMKRQGRLPGDFRVIVGQRITTSDGILIGLFLKQRVPQGMTMRATIQEVHRQDGLAYLANPGTRTGVKLAHRLPFDGFILTGTLGEFYRTLQLMDDEGVREKPFLFSTRPRCAEAAGLVYSIVLAPDTEPEHLKEAMRQGAAYGAGEPYLPILGLVSFAPIAKVEKWLNKYFGAIQSVERFLESVTGADNVEIVLSWHPDMYGLTDLLPVPDIVRSMWQNDSDLTHTPRLWRVGVSYSSVRFSWDAREGVYLVETGLRF